MTTAATEAPTVEDILAISRVRDLTVTGRARALREAAHLSQGDIAAVCDTTISAVSRWEKGRTRVPRSRAVVYARILAELEARAAEERA